MSWYQSTTEKIYKELKTSTNGLSNQEAAARLNTYGPNQLSVHKDPWWRVVIEPFRNVFAAVLGAAAIVSLLSHETLDAVIITAIITVNAIIFYTQHYATSRVLRSLKKHSVQKVTALRGGEQITISSIDLVPGDIIFLSEGERVAADVRIVHADALQIDESSLTGESTPVRKHPAVLTNQRQIYEQENMAFQGTYVVAGSAQAVIVETGSRTEYGKIAKLAATGQSKSPVQVKIDHLITLLVRAITVVAVIVFFLSLMRGIPMGEAVRFVLSLSVSAVPEGLPVALTVIIVLGMRRMARQKALVRSFKAIEDIGLITTIATDKTGTLTKNRLSVVDRWSMTSDTSLDRTTGNAIDGSAKNPDPLDTALMEHLKGKKPQPADKIYPFDLSLRMSGAYVQKDGIIYIKGSPEHLLTKSKLTKDQRHAAESAMHELASKGYRVIAFATYKAGHKAPNDLSVIGKSDLDFAGYLAFADELRSEAPAAIRAAQAAGISVRLITGDHYETAYNIGKNIGLAAHPSQVIKGTDLPSETKALAAVIKDKTVFARILPEDKFKILKALKETEITAMTGDGVNDVPALANAHVGIAMGSGSDIARDAGGIVLLNDNFATIIKAIAEGRKIFDNIRRMLFYLLSTSLGEVITMIGALLFGLPLPVTAIQILWINLVTDTALVLPLGLEPAEEGHMKRPPRRPKDPLLSRMLLSRMGVIALTMAIVTLIIVAILHGRGQDVAYIQTVAFMALIAAQWTNAFNARSEYQSSFSRLKNKNYGLLVGFIIAFGLQMTVMFGPLQSVFNIQDVPLTTLLISSVVMAIAILSAGEVHKFFSRRAAIGTGTSSKTHMQR